MAKPAQFPKQLLLFFSGLLLLTISATAAQPIPLNHTLIRKNLDGIDSIWLDLNGGTFAGRYYPSGNWIAMQQPSPGASLSFYNRIRPEILMHFSVFPAGQLIASFDEEAIAGYVSGLPTSFGGATVQLLNAGSFVPPVGSPPFVGGGYRTIKFQLIDPKTNQPTLAVADFLSVSGSGLSFRLRFSAPVDLFELMEPSFARELFLFTDER